MKIQLNLGECIKQVRLYLQDRYLREQELAKKRQSEREMPARVLTEMGFIPKSFIQSYDKAKKIR